MTNGAKTQRQTLDQVLDTLKTRIEPTPKERGFPSIVKAISYGKCLVAAQDLEAGTVVERFQGQEVDYSTVTGSHKNYVLNHDPLRDKSYSGWMYVTSPAKYSNHSCDPNCVINDRLEIETTRPVKEGQEMTFFYNEGAESDEWDQAWTFQCQCGATKCQGLVDRYRDKEVLQPYQTCKHNDANF